MADTYYTKELATEAKNRANQLSDTLFDLRFENSAKKAADIMKSAGIDVEDLHVFGNTDPTVWRAPMNSMDTGIAGPWVDGKISGVIDTLRNSGDEVAGKLADQISGHLSDLEAHPTTANIAKINKQAGAIKEAEGWFKSLEGKNAADHYLTKDAVTQLKSDIGRLGTDALSPSAAARMEENISTVLKHGRPQDVEAFTKAMSGLDDIEGLDVNRAISSAHTLRLPDTHEAMSGELKTSAQRQLHIGTADTVRDNLASEIMYGRSNPEMKPHYLDALDEVVSKYDNQKLTPGSLDSIRNDFKQNLMERAQDQRLPGGVEQVDAAMLHFDDATTSFKRHVGGDLTKEIGKLAQAGNESAATMLEALKDAPGVNTLDKMANVGAMAASQGRSSSAAFTSLVNEAGGNLTSRMSIEDIAQGLANAMPDRPEDLAELGSHATKEAKSAGLAAVDAAKNVASGGAFRKAFNGALEKAGKAVPVVGGVAGGLSIVDNASAGEYKEATLDAVGFVPVVGDAVDLVRTVPDVASLGVEAGKYLFGSPPTAEQLAAVEKQAFFNAVYDKLPDTPGPNTSPEMRQLIDAKQNVLKAEGVSAVADNPMQQMQHTQARDAQIASAQNGFSGLLDTYMEKGMLGGAQAAQAPAQMAQQHENEKPAGIDGLPKDVLAQATLFGKGALGGATESKLESVETEVNVAALAHKGAGSSAAEGRAQG